MPAMAMLHTTDPAYELIDKIGDLSGIVVNGSYVLAVIYQRPAKTKSGIILADVTRDEDKFQGKVALVVKCGPMVGDDRSQEWFGGADKTPQAMEWIVLRPSDGFAVSVNQTECRMVRDTDIKMRVSTPDSVW